MTYINNGTNFALSSLNHTWILDLDGTIVKHNGYKIDGHDTFLDGAREFLNDIPDGDMIIFITSRTDKYKELTESFLKENCIRYDYIIYNAPYGERILINDKKPSGLQTAVAFNAERDIFFKKELIDEYNILAKGREYLFFIEKKYGFDAANSCVIIFSSYNEELNTTAIKCLPEYLHRKYIDKAIIVYNDNLDINMSATAEDETFTLYYENVSRDTMDSLLKYYLLTESANNIVVVSLEEPYANGAIIGHKGITMYDYVLNGIYV